MVSKMSWLGQNAGTWYFPDDINLSKLKLIIIVLNIKGISSMHYNKAMNISVWISTDGRVYFVKCHRSHSKSRRGSKESTEVFGLVIYINSGNKNL
jgi:hypothetical protein